MSWRAAVAAAALALVVSPTVAPASPTQGTQTPRWNPKLEWPLASLQADALWRHTLGTGVAIAIVDTGIDTTRPDLIGTVIGTPVNLTSGPATDVSDDSHGTAVAGLIAGRGRSLMAGLAPQASLIDIKVTAQPDKSTPKEIAEGITRAVEAGADIINVSLGTRYDDNALRQAVAFAEHQGCLIVASAGDTRTPQYPAGDPGVVSVAAIDREGAPVPRPGPGLGTPVSLYAPGADLFSTGKTGSGNGYRYHIDGSDYAAAYVSAAAALLLSSGTPLSPEQAGHLLVSRAAPVIGGVPGVGALDPLAALPRPTPAPTPTSPPASPPISPRVTTTYVAVHHSGQPGLIAIVIIILVVLFLGLLAAIRVIASRPSAPRRWPPPGQVPGQEPLEPSSWNQTW
jgi:subtilisin family serine protease